MPEVCLCSVIMKIVIVNGNTEFDCLVSYGTTQFCSLAIKRQKAEADILKQKWKEAKIEMEEIE